MQENELGTHKVLCVQGAMTTLDSWFTNNCLENQPSKCLYKAVSIIFQKKIME